MLDFGCNTGRFSEMLEKHGFEAVGVDVNTWALGEARRLRPGPLYAADLDLVQGSFDAIAAIQVLDHLPDPRSSLEVLRRRLRPGGQLLATTGNRAAYPSRVAFALAGKRFGYDPTHLFFFRPRDLRRLAREAGFTQVRSRTYLVYPRVIPFGPFGGEILLDARIGPPGSRAPAEPEQAAAHNGGNADP